MPLRPCLDCGRLTPDRRCPPHRIATDNARYARRGSREERGLGYAYRKERAELIARTGLTHCPQCGEPFTEANPITAEHGQPRALGGTEITALICRRCNSSNGATVRRNRHPAE